MPYLPPKKSRVKGGDPIILLEDRKKLAKLALKFLCFLENHMLGFKFDVFFFRFFLGEFCAQGCFRLCSAVRHGFGSSVGSSCGACWDAGLDLLSSVHTGHHGQQRHLVKAEALVSHLVKMGLRHPSERTHALVACMVTGCGGDFMADDVSRQTTLLSTCKRVLKSKITRARVQGVVILPNAFDALPVEIRQQVFCRDRS